MRIGFIGLGRMGSNIVLNLLEKKFEVVVWNRSRAPVEKAAASGAIASESIEDLCKRLTPPRIIWILVPAGDVVDEMISRVRPNISKGDIVVDGGNSFYKDSLRRYEDLKSDGIHFLDVGTSGGLEGARHGACLTIGGDREVFESVEPALKAMAIEGGYLYVGPSGSGHYTKIIHNGMEYAILQAYGEGFEALRNSPYELDLAAVAKVWMNGSVIRSWLLELAGKAMEKDPVLGKITQEIGGGQTGRWSIDQAWESNSPFSLISLAFSMRIHTRLKESFAGKVVAATRNEFGGHAVTLAEEE